MADVYEYGSKNQMPEGLESVHRDLNKPYVVVTEEQLSTMTAEQSKSLAKRYSDRGVEPEFFVKDPNGNKITSRVNFDLKSSQLSMGMNPLNEKYAGAALETNIFSSDGEKAFEIFRNLKKDYPGLGCYVADFNDYYKGGRLIRLGLCGDKWDNREIIDAFVTRVESEFNARGIQRVPFGNDRIPNSAFRVVGVGVKNDNVYAKLLSAKIDPKKVVKMSQTAKTKTELKIGESVPTFTGNSGEGNTVSLSATIRQGADAAARSVKSSSGEAIKPNTIKPTAPKTLAQNGSSASETKGVVKSAEKRSPLRRLGRIFGKGR